MSVGVRFVCPFCFDDGRKVRYVIAESGGQDDHLSHSDEPCERFQKVLDDEMEADEFLRLARLRMSE